MCRMFGHNSGRAGRLVGCQFSRRNFNVFIYLFFCCCLSVSLIFFISFVITVTVLGFFSLSCSSLSILIFLLLLGYSFNPISSSPTPLSSVSSYTFVLFLAFCVAVSPSSLPFLLPPHYVRLPCLSLPPPPSFLSLSFFLLSSCLFPSSPLAYIPPLLSHCASSLLRQETMKGSIKHPDIFPQILPSLSTF